MMNKLDASTSPIPQLPAGADPLALLEEGLRPATLVRAGDWEPLGVAEVAGMLPGYAIKRLLGSGGMGAVYEAVQRDLQRRVAIKLLAPALAETPGLTVRFRYESQLMASLQHPGIVQVYEAGETVSGHLFYVMEYVDGEDLATRMQRGLLPLEEAVGLIAQVADALQAAHRLGMVHRDVKPANIFLAADGPPRLGDFGLALTADQAADPLRLTRAGTTMGTLEYAAPEQLARTQSVMPASDVYSLGVLTYEMLTGELPRGHFDPPSVRNPAVDPAFDGVVLHALQSDPARRFTDAGEFRTAFLQAADRRRQQALRDAVVRRKMLRRAWLVAALSAVALTTGGSAVLAWRARREAENRRVEAESAEQRMAGLFQFLLTDLRQRLEPTGNLGAMDSVLEKAVEHFRRHHEENGNSPETALQLADVLVTKADVIGMRGMKEEAAALYSEALTLTEFYAAAAPQDEGRQVRVFQALLDRTEFRMAVGDYDGALEDGRAMLRQANAMALTNPGPRITRCKATAHRATGNALGYLDEFEEARDEYLRARTLLKELVTAEPGNQIFTYELAALDMSLGSNAEVRGDLEGMLRHFTAYNDFVTQREGTDSNTYSHSAFRMGVAMIKLQRPAEAVPYLTDAVRISERDAAKLPGHKGSLNHVAWCVRYLAQAHEMLGNTEAAAPLRAREAQVYAMMAAGPEAVVPTLESEFSRLAADKTAERQAWWVFCQDLQRAAEAQPDKTAAQRYYEDWITRASAAAPAGEAGAFIQLVPAFLHNRLSTLQLEEDAARAGQHARAALALRAAVSAAHPDEPWLHRDVLSSACHAATAAVRGADATAALTDLQKIAECARLLPVAALTLEDNALFFSERSVQLLEYAASRWPDHAPDFQQTSREIATALLDRLPPEQAREENAAALRQRLTRLAAAPEK